MSIEFWAMGRPYPSGPNSPEFSGVRQAVRAEEIGYDGIVYVDSQNRYGETYVCLALAAHATSTIKLGTGVTNSFTRHPAVTASAIATVQMEAMDGPTSASHAETQHWPTWVAPLIPFRSSSVT